MAQALRGNESSTGGLAVRARSAPVFSALLVGVTGLIASLLSFLDGRVAGNNLAPTLNGWLLAPVLYLGFWMLCSLLINTGARMMQRPSRRAQVMEISARCLPVLLITGLIGILQSALLRMNVSTDVVTAVGVLNLVIFGGFVALLTVRVADIYSVNKANALALVLLPLSAVSAVILLFVLAASIASAVTGA